MRKSVCGMHIQIYTHTVMCLCNNASKFMTHIDVYLLIVPGTIFRHKNGK